MSLEQDKEVILYQGQPLEVIRSRSLVLPDSPAARRFFLPSGVVVGCYGVTGFVIFDSRPEKRFVTYTDGEWIGIEYSENDKKYFQISHPGQNPTHFFDTDTGFKMIRYFALPPSVREFFSRDRFLGDPMIDKCCRQGTLPEEFDEVPSAWNWAFCGASENEIREVTNSVILGANPHLTKEQLEDWEHPWREVIYLSFHPWRDMEHVLTVGADSIYAAIYNFDEVIRRFDKDRKLTPRDLRLSDKQSGTLQLPPPTT